MLIEMFCKFPNQSIRRCSYLDVVTVNFISCKCNFWNKRYKNFNSTFMMSLSEDCFKNYNRKRKIDMDHLGRYLFSHKFKSLIHVTSRHSN